MKTSTDRKFKQRLVLSERPKGSALSSAFCHKIFFLPVSTAISLEQNKLKYGNNSEPNIEQEEGKRQVALVHQSERLKSKYTMSLLLQDTMILTKCDVRGTVQKQQVLWELAEEIIANKEIRIPVIYCLALT